MGRARCPHRAANVRRCPKRAELVDLRRRGGDTAPYLQDRKEHGRHARASAREASRSAAGSAGEPPDTEGAGCPKLLNRLNGLLIVRGLPAQPKATTGCVALRIRHYELHSTDRTPEGAKVVY